MRVIDEMEFSDVIRMMDFWAEEPPANYLMRVYWGFGAKDEEETGSLANKFSPDQVMPFHRLPKVLQRLNIDRYLRLNPGKTEKDFFQQLEAKRLERYEKQLKEAREKKNG